MTPPRITIEREGDLFAVYIEDETSAGGERKRWHVRSTPDYAGACGIAWKKACNATDKRVSVQCANSGVDNG